MSNDIGQQDAPQVHDFGWALKQLQNGCRVARAGWNGKGMWIAMTRGRTVTASGLWGDANRRWAESLGDYATVEILPYLTMKTESGAILVGWLASQVDMLALDWEIV